jgi:hypothetical protein
LQISCLLVYHPLRVPCALALSEQVVHSASCLSAAADRASVVVYVPVHTAQQILPFYNGPDVGLGLVVLLPVVLQNVSVPLKGVVHGSPAVCGLPATGRVLGHAVVDVGQTGQQLGQLGRKRLKGRGRRLGLGRVRVEERSAVAGAAAFAFAMASTEVVAEFAEGDQLYVNLVLELAGLKIQVHN